MFAILAASAFIAILAYVCVRHYVFDNSEWVGPKGYPLIGNALDIDMTRLHLQLTEWSLQFGDMFVIRILGAKLFVLNSPAVIREALLDKPNDVIFGTRVVPSFTGEYLMNDYSDIIFSPYSPRLVERRKCVHRLLKMYGEGSERLEDIITKHLEQLVEEIQSHGGQPVDLGDNIEHLLYNIVGVLVSTNYMFVILHLCCPCIRATCRCAHPTHAILPEGEPSVLHSNATRIIPSHVFFTKS
jgi:hypothetical protein